jgi:phosphoglycolate phosphatase-like HAD superfamily hydrolase
MMTIQAPTLGQKTKSEPLAELAAVAIAAVERGENPQVVFDLDDTLFLVRPRKRAIFRELAESYGREAGLTEALHALAKGDIPYDVAEALGKVGIHHDHHVSALTKGFFSRFFDGSYTSHDEPNEGAAAYVNHLHDRGVRVVYLTGRPEEMQPRTLDTLVAHGFPVNAHLTHLMLKESSRATMPDPDFKGLKAFEIAAMGGPVLAVFDNEPANLNAMRPAMADARYFLLDTDHSPNPPALEMAAHVVTDFKAARRHLAMALANTPSFKGGAWKLDVKVQSAG